MWPRGSPSSTQHRDHTCNRSRVSELASRRTASARPVGTASKQDECSYLRRKRHAPLGRQSSGSARGRSIRTVRAISTATRSYGGRGSCPTATASPRCRRGSAPTGGRCPARARPGPRSPVNATCSEDEISTLPTRLEELMVTVTAVQAGFMSGPGSGGRCVSAPARTPAGVPAAGGARQWRTRRRT